MTSDLVIRIASIIGGLRERIVSLLVERRQVALVAVAGLAVLVLAGGAWLAVQWLLTPAVPEIGRADAQQVVEFMADPRGLIRLSGERRQRFFARLVQYYRRPERRKQLAEALQEMSPSERAVLREAVLEVVKDKVVSDAIQFHKQRDRKARDRFLKRKLAEYDALRIWISGADGGPNLTAGMDEGLPARPEAWAKYAVTRTKPAERKLARPYIDELLKRADELKRQKEALKRGRGRLSGVDVK